MLALKPFSTPQLQYLRKISPEKVRMAQCVTLPCSSLSVLFIPAQFSDIYCQNSFPWLLKCNWLLCLWSCIYPTCVFLSKQCKLMYRTEITEHFLFQSDFELCQDTLGPPLHPILRKSVGYCRPVTTVRAGREPRRDLRENRSVLTTQSPLQRLISWANVTHQSLASEWAR